MTRPISIAERIRQENGTNDTVSTSKGAILSLDEQIAALEAGSSSGSDSDSDSDDISGKGDRNIVIQQDITGNVMKMAQR